MYKGLGCRVFAKERMHVLISDPTKQGLIIRNNNYKVLDIDISIKKKLHLSNINVDYVRYISSHSFWKLMRVLMDNVTHRIYYYFDELLFF